MKLNQRQQFMLTPAAPRLVARTTEQATDVLVDVVVERVLQDLAWGGAKHDDDHTLRDWAHFIDKQLAPMLPARPGAVAVPPPNGDEARDRLVKIAALAVAALQSHDRKAAPAAAEEERGCGECLGCQLEKMEKEMREGHGGFSALDAIFGAFFGPRTRRR